MSSSRSSSQVLLLKSTWIIIALVRSPNHAFCATSGSTLNNTNVTQSRPRRCDFSRARRVSYLTQFLSNAVSVRMTKVLWHSFTHSVILEKPEKMPFSIPFLPHSLKLLLLHATRTDLNIQPYVKCNNSDPKGLEYKQNFKRFNPLPNGPPEI